MYRESRLLRGSRRWRRGDVRRTGVGRAAQEEGRGIPRLAQPHRSSGLRPRAVRAGAFSLLMLLVGLVPAASAGTVPKATAISAATDHACALLSDATVKCWGSNGSGQLGDGTHTRRLTAVAVQRLAGAAGVSTAWETSCALLAAGTATCWGDNRFGELGDGTKTSSSTPVAVQGLTDAVAVSTGGSSACALLVDHTVVCWGDNSRGELGTGTRVSSPTPVAVLGLNDATAVSVGNQHACALRAAGTVSCWGWSGQLGPVADAGDKLTATVVPNLTDAITISGDPYHACALTRRGVAECWDASSAPTVVRGFANMSAYSFSEDGQQTDHSCAIIVSSAAPSSAKAPTRTQGRSGTALRRPSRW
jgi:Regulator of chromosome condensation (RCC1) repeat